MIEAPKRTRARKSIGPSALPWTPPEMSKHEAYAIRAFVDGQASEAQQKLVWKFLIRLTGIQDLEFRPDERASTFASGKRFVGLMLAKPLGLTAKTIDQLDP